MDPIDYWNHHNVSNHKIFTDFESSNSYLEWRNNQYLFVEDFLPKKEEIYGQLLDFGCGPGNDLLHVLNNGAKNVIGVDVSHASIKEANKRLLLHNYPPCAQVITPNSELPFETNTFDLIQANGVLHHLEYPAFYLSELSRVLKPNGTLRVMVYNKDSIWYHLYCAYIKMFQIDNSRLTLINKIKRKLNQAPVLLEIEDVFRMSTDGLECPISIAWSPKEFISLADTNRLDAKFIGSSISLHEMNLLNRIYGAISDERLNLLSASFLKNLEFDKFNRPIFNGNVAGINAHYLLTKKSLR